jgi:alpha-L-fucosidase
MPIYEPTWESLSQCRIPEWFRKAKFGIFIHWSIYSVPAMFDEWYPRRMYQKDSVIYEGHCETYGIDFGYKDFIPTEKPGCHASVFEIMMAVGAN